MTAPIALIDCNNYYVSSMHIALVIHLVVFINSSELRESSTSYLSTDNRI